MEINERVNFGAHVNEGPVIQEAARATKTREEEAIAFEGEVVRAAEADVAHAVA